jgi:triphosphoribosyl-dephospho-CoA synthetase
MSNVPDTNILGRHGPEILEMVRSESRAALAAGAMFTAAGRRRVRRLTARFRERNISPGGSADLLAVTLFLHNLSI